jgi:N,N'-diacetyllegionaminate synthase
MGVYIIAEAGVNHNGSLELAFELVRQAKKAGCDCIKFQTFKAENLITRTAPKAEYQIKNTKNNGSQFEMLKKLELPIEKLIQVKNLCDEIKIDFLSSPFSIEDAAELEEIGMKKYKLPSGEITNKPLLQFVGKTGKPIILSTGMSTVDEVQKALDWIYETGNNKITLLHCTSNYPTPVNEVNMRSMLTLKERFGLPVGYSDHTKGTVIPVMAAAMGAEVIEKHMTLDRNMDGPDHKASLEPSEMKELVNDVRMVEKAFGSGEKVPNQSEIPTRALVRKSIISTRTIKKGAVITSEDICCKRPGTGLPPEMFEQTVGKIAARDIEPDSILNFDDFVKTSR